MFNSRDPIYRSPTGAIPFGESIHFRISPERILACREAYLVIESECEGKQAYNMFWSGMNGDLREWWECHYTPKCVGVCFYHFELKTDHGHRHFFKGINGELERGSFRNPWQLTVYEKDFKTPDWLVGGIIYQIFPDRFNFSGVEKFGIPQERIIRENWGDTPYWKPNSKGEITNSDYFKGDLKGIEQKLQYLKELGVTCIYLNPIFEAHSNHRYDTADYSKIDPLLGKHEDYVSLCKSAKKMGIKIILDGVFNHTGSDSIYFNRERRYECKGAHNSQKSQYYSWYNFSNWNESYDCWWGFKTLPNINENNNDYQEFISGEKGIIRKWLKDGASGWRLDVVDELQDNTLYNIYKAAKEEDPDAIVLGEVWEDASNKMAYGQTRKYLLGGQMDSVMNYPFREAIIGFLSNEYTSLCMEMIENVVENYPPQVLRLLMNHIGTHDTERVITLLAGDPLNGRDRAWQHSRELSPLQWGKGIVKMKLASLLQFTLPGVPSIYYGDEVGTQGYKDPFNRGCYPWGKENYELLNWYKELAALRKENEVFKEGKLRNIFSVENVMCFERYGKTENGDESIIIAVNRSENFEVVPIKQDGRKCIIGKDFENDELILPPYGYSVLKKV